jgi:hypothetical protein
MSEQSELLTTREKAAELKCSARTLERLRSTGGGPPFTYVAGLVRYFAGNDFTMVTSTAEAAAKGIGRKASAA